MLDEQNGAEGHVLAHILPLSSAGRSLPCALSVVARPRRFGPVGPMNGVRSVRPAL